MRALIGEFCRQKITARAQQRELCAMIFRKFKSLRKSQNERALRSMHVVQIPTGLLKLVLTSSKRGTSLPDLSSREPKCLCDTQRVNPQALRMKQEEAQGQECPWG